MRGDDAVTTRGDDAVDTNPNRFALLALYVALVANSYALANVFSYAGFLVLHLGLTGDERAVGFFAGLIMSSFMGGRMVTSLCCGHISDKFGRKVVILIGLWSCLVFQLVFGFATTFWQAVAARFLMGACNGIIAAAKTMCAELVAPKKQAGAMSAIAGTWGVGMVLGTALGGVLAEPADTFSFVSADGLLGRHPYALPNIVGSLIAAMAIVFVSKFLPETVAVQPWRWPRPCCFGALPSKRRPARRRFELASLRGGGGSTGARYAHVGGSSMASGAAGIPRVGAAETLCSGDIFIVIGLYCVVSLNSMVFGEILPLWCLAPRASGGLALLAGSIGAIGAATGGFLALFQFVVFPPIADRISTVVLFKRSAAVLPLFYLVFPQIAFVPNDSARMTLLVLCSCAMKAVEATMFTTIFTCINNSVDKSRRGRVNGVAMGVASFFKMLGPIGGTALFAWSLTSGTGPPFDVHFCYILMFVLGVATAAVAHLKLAPGLSEPFRADPELPSSNGTDDEEEEVTTLDVVSTERSERAAV